MDIPITGFIMHSNDEDSNHSHKLFITTWNGHPVHAHPFSGLHLLISLLIFFKRIYSVKQFCAFFFKRVSNQRIIEEV
ncbi:hypothetical protein QFZ81_004012 [Paenibacillus sp. V4I9]|nr:hypothetical protein [Paenibacillus sp. V4I9]